MTDKQYDNPRIVKNFMGDGVDIHDPSLLDSWGESRMTGKTFKGMDIDEIAQECERELGYTLLYMDYLRPFDWGDQRGRVEKLCKEYAKNIFSVGNIQYWRSLYYRIRDENENMC